MSPTVKMASVSASIAPGQSDFFLISLEENRLAAAHPFFRLAIFLLGYMQNGVDPQS